MSEEKSTERGLLTDLFIFILIIGLALVAIYFSGYWDVFMKYLLNIDQEIRNIMFQAKEGIDAVTSATRTLQQ